MAVEVRQFGVEARQLELRRGRKPIHGAEKDAGAPAVHLHRNGRMGLRLDLIFNRGDEDGVFDDGDDDAAGREVYDHFFSGHVLDLLGSTRARGKRDGDCQNEERRDLRMKLASRTTKSAVKRPKVEKQRHPLTVPQNYCDRGKRGKR